jgi:hypothetical protein
MRFGDPVVGLRRRNRLAVGYPPYVCQPVLEFSSNFFGSITHRGGRDARVPVRLTFWFCRCVLAIQLSACADVTARRSVTHLTFANPFLRSVQTCSVLLRTEAGGTPAFQSVTASRQTWRLQLAQRITLTFWFCWYSEYTAPTERKRVGEHLPTRFGVQFKLVRCYYAQRRAGRPRSSPSPLRSELVWYNEDISLAFQSAIVLSD